MITPRTSQHRAAINTPVGASVNQVLATCHRSSARSAGPIAAGFLSGEGAFDAAGGILDQLAEASPAGRLGTPEEVAAVAAFLARPEASWVNGQLLTVNGGAMI
jgi:3-oxoacyl-[acyl-carrier protein] reductase